MDVVLGLGNAPDSGQALEETVSRTAKTGDALTIAILCDRTGTDPPQELRERVEETLDEYAIESRIVELEGEPGPALTTYAETEGFDRIVIGGGNRSPMGKIALGEVTEFVVLNADTSVTLIR